MSFDGDARAANYTSTHMSDLAVVPSVPKEKQRRSGRFRNEAFDVPFRYQASCDEDIVREIARDTGTNRWIMLRVYIDDSSDEKQERVVVAGAYIGFYKGWSKLWAEWRQQLKNHNLDYFRATDYYSLRGEFQQFRDPVKYPKPLGSQAAKAALGDLERVIETNELAGIAVCVPMNLYSEVRKTEKHADEIFNPDAFHTALMALFKSSAEWVRDEFPGDTVGFYCDDSSRSPIYAALYASFKQCNPGLAWFMQGLSHIDDKRSPQMQTADLMAHLARVHFLERFPNFNDGDVALAKIEDFPRLRKLKVFSIQVWTRAYMMGVLKHEIERRGLQ